ncbi:MAG: hypothetical protein ACLFN9_22710 [Desulfococcaceae bacterium]
MAHFGLFFRPAPFMLGDGIDCAFAEWNVPDAPGPSGGQSSPVNGIASSVEIPAYNLAIPLHFFVNYTQLFFDFS